MKMVRAIVGLVSAAGMFAALPGVANAEEGYVRIGNNCYTILTIPNGYTYLVNVPCPNDLSENP